MTMEKMEQLEREAAALGLTVPQMLKQSGKNLLEELNRINSMSIEQFEKDRLEKRHRKS